MTFGRDGRLDGLRAIAALSVVVFHVATASGVIANGGAAGVLSRGLGSAGVAIFFVLSGFLLYGPYARAHLAGTAPRPLRTYLRHRFLRIFPAYWIAVAGTIALLGLAVPATFANLASILTLTDMYLDRPYITNSPVSVAWTLTAELLFYLLLPLIAVVIRSVIGARARRPGARLASELAGIGVLVAVATLYRLLAVTGDLQLGVNDNLWLPNYLGWFAGGMLLGVLAAWWEVGGRLPQWLVGLAGRPWLCWLLAGWAYVVQVVLRARVIPEGVAFIGEPDPLVLGRFPLTGVFAVLVVAPVALGSVLARPRADAGSVEGWSVVAPTPASASGRDTDGTVGAGRRSGGVLNSGALVWLGTISYGIYLWHVTWLDWLTDHTSLTGFWPLLAADLAITIPTAALSWYVVEERVLRFKDRRQPPLRSTAGPSSEPTAAR